MSSLSVRFCSRHAPLPSTGARSSCLGPVGEGVSRVIRTCISPGTKENTRKPTISRTPRFKVTCSHLFSSPHTVQHVWCRAGRGFDAYTARRELPLGEGYKDPSPSPMPFHLLTLLGMKSYLLHYDTSQGL